MAITAKDWRVTLGPAMAGLGGSSVPPEAGWDSRSTSETAAICGLALSTASHHLAVLRRAGLVSSVRRGGTMQHTRTVIGDALAMTPG